MERAVQFQISMGVLNEYLHRYEDAIAWYLGSGMEPKVHLRLLTLYEHAGQVQDFLDIIRRYNLWYQSRQKDPLSAIPLPLSRTVDRLIAIREMAAMGR